MNKNTRKLKRMLRKAARKGETQIQVEVPTPNFHSSRALMWKTFSTHKSAVSRNNRRNLQQRVLSNSGGGPNSSLTVHEAIDKLRPVKFKNHRYMKEDKHFAGYRQPFEKPA